MTCDLRTLIVGLGSDFGDDRLGAVVVERLRKVLSRHDFRYVGTPVKLIDVLGGFDRLHVVDACRGGDEPGTIIRRAWPISFWKSARCGGTHDFDLPEVLTLAEQMHTLPPQVTIWGIQVTEDVAPADFRRPLSPPVVDAVDRLLQRIMEEVEDDGNLISEQRHHA